MKAIVYTEYGPPEILQLKEVERPSPRDDQVLVRVHAASVNYPDWGLLRGKPFLIRLVTGGFLEPKHKILGADLAGRVEAVGRNVKQFQPSDEVFGNISECGFGSFAEYVVEEDLPEHRAGEVRVKVLGVGVSAYDLLHRRSGSLSGTLPFTLGERTSLAWWKSWWVVCDEHGITHSRRVADGRQGCHSARLPRPAPTLKCTACGR